MFGVIIQVFNFFIDFAQYISRILFFTDNWKHHFSTLTNYLKSDYSQLGSPANEQSDERFLFYMSKIKTSDDLF